MLGLGNTIVSDQNFLMHVFTDLYSLNFDGIDGYVGLDGFIAEYADIHTAGTISVWIKVATTSSTGNIIRMQADSDNFVSILYHASSNTLRTTYKGDGSGTTCRDSTAIEGDGNWHHVASTWGIGEEDSKKLNLYLDGTLKETRPSSGSIDSWAEGETVEEGAIGQSSAGASYFKGNIDDIAMFNKELSSEQVADLYNSGKPSNVPTIGSIPLVHLITYFRFEEGTGAELREEQSGTMTAYYNADVNTWSTDTP